ncbi:hypothetical protein IAU60_002870 [Kwoniella sp. DSM 27419]
MPITAPPRHVYDPSMYMTQEQSGLALYAMPPGSPEGHLPSLQVTHPTPTKASKFRRQSSGTMSVSPSSSFDPSPLSGQQVLQSPGAGALDIMGNVQRIDAQEDSEDERELQRQKEKQARVREKGRERQRRKRERDKRLKESSGRGLSISVPSSVSTFSTSLPQSAQYFSVSPGQPFSFSTSTSGASTPAALFSPGPGFSPDVSISSAFLGMVEGLPVDTAVIAEGSHNMREGSTSVTPSSMSRRASLSSQPDNPSKRRKSDAHPGQILGLGMTGLMPLPQSKQIKSERPRPRRTASDGAVKHQEREWRSPTPPPVPSLPSEYRKKPVEAASSQADIFASRVLFLLDKDNQETGWLKDQIGITSKDLEGFETTLAGLYDRWILEKRIKDMTIDDEPSQRSVSDSSALFFTPTARQRPRVNTRGSPVVTTHGRQRSLSSASMLARGLHISPLYPPQGSYPATPNSHPSSAEPWSDDTVSPSLQTPSTGNGSFPSHDQIPSYQGHWRAATDPTSQRTYTTTHQTPTQQITQSDWSQAAPQTCPTGVSLDSPLSMAEQIKNGGMPPPPLLSQLSEASMSDVVMPQAQFTTPNTSRTSTARAVMPVPYTPPTPVPMRGQNHTLQDGTTGVPVWYNPTFMASNVPEAATYSLDMVYPDQFGQRSDSQ